MGFLNIFQSPKTPMVTKILSDATRQEILNGRLPILRKDKFFLKANESCHYIDKAIYEMKVTKKRYVWRNNCHSMPGLY